MRCRKFGYRIFGRNIGYGGVGFQHHGVTLNLTFDLVVGTLTYKILSGLYLGNCKVLEVDTW